jgi:hypothetical protein
MKSIQEAVASVQNAFPSIYTKDDVVKLLTSIEIDETPKSGSRLTDVQIKQLIADVAECIENNASNIDSSEVIDKSSAEFSISYSNQVEIDSIDIDTDSIYSTVVDGVGDVIESFFEKLEEEDEVADV